jgi:hypothetical protein
MKRMPSIQYENELLDEMLYSPKFEVENKKYKLECEKLDMNSDNIEITILNPFSIFRRPQQKRQKADGEIFE